MSEYGQKKFESYTRGYKALNEYIIYNNAEQALRTQCQILDKQEKGYIKRDDFKQVLERNFRYHYHLTQNDIQNVLFDAPKPQGQQDKFILFNLLIDQMKQEENVSSCFSMANKYCQKYLDSDDNNINLADQCIEKQKKIIFERQDYYDLQNYDLPSFDYTPESVTGEDKNNKNDKGTGLDDNMLDLSEQNVLKVTTNIKRQQNNITILNNLSINFSADASNFIKQKALSSKIEASTFKDMLMKQMKLPNPYEIILEDEFIEILTNSDTRLVEKNLTKDECKLIYWQIWQFNRWKQMNFMALVNFINEFRVRNTTELVHAMISDQQLRKQIQKKQPNPILFRELVKYGFTYGISFLETSLKPLMEKDNYVDVANIKLLFNSLSIKYNQSNIEDLRNYLAENGVIVLEDYNQNQYLSSRILVNCQNLFKLIEEESQGIAVLQKDLEQKKHKNHEQARNSIHAKIIEGVINRLIAKSKVYTDENNMIEEIKLRQTVAEMFPEIQQSDLDVIFSKLQNCTQPSKYLAQRKIYVPEFMGFLKSGPVFEDLTLEENGQQKLGDKKDQIENQQITTSSQQIQEQVGKQNQTQLKQKTQEQAIKQLVIPQKAQFEYEEKEQAFIANKLQDKNLYESLFKALHKKFIKFNKQKSQLTQLQQIDQMCQDFRNLIQLYDPQQLGCIKCSQLKEILQIEFQNDLPEAICNYIVRLAQNISQLPNQSNVLDPEIKYTFFCFNIHKYLFTNQIYNVQQ